MAATATRTRKISKADQAVIDDRKSRDNLGFPAAGEITDAQARNSVISMHGHIVNILNLGCGKAWQQVLDICISYGKQAARDGRDGSAHNWRVMYRHALAIAKEVPADA